MKLKEDFLKGNHTFHKGLDIGDIDLQKIGFFDIPKKIFALIPLSTVNIIK